MLARTRRTELIGTVANRTLFHLHLDDGDTRVVELLWRDHDGRWLVEDARVFSTPPRGNRIEIPRRENGL